MSKNELLNTEKIKTTNNDNSELTKSKNLEKILRKKKPTFVCVMCKQKFKKHSALLEHFKDHGKNTIDIKGRPIEGSTRLKNPKPEQEKPQMIPCDFCHEVLANMSKAIEHKYRKHKNEGTNHFCELCGKLFPLRIVLDKHKEDTHASELACKKESTKVEACSFCTATFITQSALEFHIKNCHKYQSELLLPVFVPPPSTKIKLGNNSQAYSVYYCYLCGNEYMLKFNLRKHLRERHQQEQITAIPIVDIIRCKTCEAIFYNENAFNIHLKYHNASDWHVTSEEQRLQIVGRVDQDFDYRRVPTTTGNIDYRVLKRSQPRRQNNASLAAKTPKQTFDKKGEKKDRNDLTSESGSENNFNESSMSPPSSPDPSDIEEENDKSDKTNI